MTLPVDAIQRFWAGFEQRADRLALITSADDPIYDESLHLLQEIDPGLYFEVSSDSQSPELIITAEGNERLFGLVEETVARAPRLDRWTVTALKPKLGFPASTSWEGFTVDIATVCFEPLERHGAQDLGLRIYVRGLASDDSERAHAALLRAIDHGLGERAFAESVQHVEVAPLPEGVEQGAFIPLVDLENYIEWRKR